MREAGLKRTFINTRIGFVNAYLKWTDSPLRVPKLKTGAYVPGIYSRVQVQPTLRSETTQVLPAPSSCPRAHPLLDTGVRLDEALSLVRPRLQP